MENSWNKVDEALIEATKEGKVNEVRHLLENGAFVNTRDEDGWTPLMFAAKSDNVEIIDLLMENGADNELRNIDGNKAIWMAKSPKASIAIFQGIKNQINAKKATKNNTPTFNNDGRS